MPAEGLPIVSLSQPPVSTPQARPCPIALGPLEPPHPRDVGTSTGCKRSSADANACVQIAPLVFRESAHSVREAQKAVAAQRRAPLCGGARAEARSPKTHWRCAVCAACPAHGNQQANQAEFNRGMCAAVSTTSHHRGVRLICARMSSDDGGHDLDNLPHILSCMDLAASNSPWRPEVGDRRRRQQKTPWLALPCPSCAFNPWGGCENRDDRYA